MYIFIHIFTLLIACHSSLILLGVWVSITSFSSLNFHEIGCFYFYAWNSTLYIESRDGISIDVTMLGPTSVNQFNPFHDKQWNVMKHHDKWHGFVMKYHQTYFTYHPSDLLSSSRIVHRKSICSLFIYPITCSSNNCDFPFDPRGLMR